MCGFVVWLSFEKGNGDVVGGCMIRITGNENVTALAN